MAAYFRYGRPLITSAMEASEGFGMSGALLVIILTLWTVAEGADKWSDDAVYYRLDVDSFKDDDGDGLGDLTGATQKITYVKALGADAVVLSVLAVHSRECSRPGILDLANIDDRYGSMAQLGDLLSKARKIDLKMLITFPTQTISVASEWFLSSANKTPGFEDWVYWREGVEDQEPSAGQGFAWKWHEERNAWWGVKDDQAMLNLCSSGVSTALSTALCAWIRRGLSGVVIGLDYLIEPNCGQKLLRQMVSSASDCARASSMDLPVILIESSLGIDKAIDLYGEENGAVTARLASNALTLIPKPTTPELALRLYAGLMYSSEKVRPVWLTSDIKSTRIASRYGAEMIDTVNLLALMLPGSVMLQQGDELGAPDVPSEWLPSTSDKCWPNHRPRPSAAPFPWDDSTHGGFSSNEPWVPLAPNFRYFNAKAQFASDSSHVSMVRVATAMRRSPAMGPHVDIFRLGNAVAVLRWGSIGTLLVVCNPTTAGTAVQLSRIPGLAREVTVAVSSAGSSLLPETHLRVDRVIELAPGEVILLAGPPRHCGGPGPVDKIANKLSEGWQILNKYFNSA